MAVRGSWDTDALKYWRAVNNNSTTRLPVASIYPIDGIVRTLKGQPNAWASRNGLTVPKINHWDRLVFCLLHSGNGNTDTGSLLVPLRGREWQAPPLSQRENNANPYNSPTIPVDTITYTAGEPAGTAFTLSKATAGVAGVQFDLSGYAAGEVWRITGETRRFTEWNPNWRLQWRRNQGTISHTADFPAQLTSTDWEPFAFETTISANDTGFPVLQLYNETSGHKVDRAFRNLQIWRSWKNVWTPVATTAPINDAIAGGWAVLNGGAPRDGAYDGTDDYLEADISGFSSMTWVMQYIGTTKFTGSGSAIAGIGTGSGTNQHDDANGIMLRRYGTANQIELIGEASGAINKTTPRTVGDDVVTDASFYYYDSLGSGTVRHEGVSQTDGSITGGAKSPSKLIVGARYAPAPAAFSAIEPHAVALYDRGVISTNSDILVAAFKQAMAELKAL